MLAAAGFLVVLLTGCASAPQALEKGASALRRTMTPMNMKKSMFYVAYPNGKPSDYVSFMFSDVGASERMPQEGGLEFSEEEANAINHSVSPMLPAGVILQPNAPRADEENYQLVLSADDAKGVVIVTGYLPTKKADGTAETNVSPVLTKEIELAKVQPDPMVRLFYQSQIEMGASPAMRPDEYATRPR